MGSEYRKVDVVLNEFGHPKDNSYHTAWRCKACDTVIMSLHVHDWVCCKCFRNEPDNQGIFIDGGKEYLRGGGKLDNIETIYVKLK